RVNATHVPRRPRDARTARDRSVMTPRDGRMRSFAHGAPHRGRRGVLPLLEPAPERRLIPPGRRACWPSLVAVDATPGAHPGETGRHVCLQEPALTRRPAIAATRTREGGRRPWAGRCPACC